MMKDIRDQNYYELLEVDPSANQEDILKAYNRARATYGHNSPALYSLFNKDEAQQLLQMIEEAYSVLSNQFKRKQYDENQKLPSNSENLQPTQKPEANATPSMEETQEQLKEVPTPIEVAPPVQSNSEGKTAFGSYSIDPQIEEEMEATLDFDGEILKKFRIYKNISIDQLSEKTKISRSYLNALEQNNYSLLPAVVFVRGFLSQYAKHVGLNEKNVTHSYLTKLKAQSDE